MLWSLCKSLKNIEILKNIAGAIYEAMEAYEGGCSQVTGDIMPPKAYWALTLHLLLSLLSDCG